MIRDCQGDLFESGAEALVNPVNCVGVAGKGLALEFKKRWPRAHSGYEEACRTGWLQPGRITVSFAMSGEPPAIIYLPTKRHWRDASKIEDIQEGALELAACIETLRVRSIAIPALGCGLGGLNWADVRPLIVEALGGLDCDVMLYPPQEKGEPHG